MIDQAYELDWRWAALWAGWLGAFGLLELWALRTRDGGKRNGRTLSETVWWLTRSGHPALRWAARSALAGFLAWLAWHFLIEA